MPVVVEVWWSSLVAADHRLMDVLDPVERGRLAAMERPADRGRSLVGFALLRAAVARHLDVEPADVVVDRTCDDCGQPHGRPRVVGPGDARPWVSVSHSGVLVVVALSGGAAVGVDVQRVADLGEHGTQRSGGAAADAERWVRAEAVTKLGILHAGDRAGVRKLDAPTNGYAAALATLSAGDVEVLVRSWPSTSG